MENNEDKVIQMFKSPIELSPLLADDEVEVKDYTENLGGVIENTEKEPSKKDDKQPDTQVGNGDNVQADHQVKDEQNSGFFSNENQYTAPEFPDDPTEDDGIEPMSFEENNGFAAETAGSMLSDNDARTKAKMILQGYNAIIPPLLKQPLQADVSKVHYIMSYNNVEQSAIKEVEKFLNNSNKEIFQALKLNNDEMAIIAPPLAAVIQKYNVTSDNPLVNLAGAVIGVAIGKFANIKAILEAQTTHLEMIINGYNLQMPKGMENFDISKAKNVKNAA